MKLGSTWKKASTLAAALFLLAGLQAGPLWAQNPPAPAAPAAAAPAAPAGPTNDPIGADTSGPLYSPNSYLAGWGTGVSSKPDGSDW
ncbi:MAG TPA: hypothetical protein VL359_15655, partial [bacterium]|nr:hypothetical protein [bacterium]